MCEPNANTAIRRYVRLREAGIYLKVKGEDLAAYKKALKLPVKGEGCLSCHTPHGSQNARLLNVPSINVLCAQCHSMVGTNAVHNATLLSQSSDVTPCIGCHTMVHGSNLDQFLKR